MPATVRIRIIAARNLPVMDRASEKTDAFVEIRLGQHTQKTEVYPKSLFPQWNSEWFTFEVDDYEFLEEPLIIRVMDYDTYSANDAIGRVHFDLTNISHPTGPNKIGGWFPIYDTMHGIRGSIYVVIKMDVFSSNKNIGGKVPIFTTGEVPVGYELRAVFGFIEELIVQTDPEYQWIDKIRPARASNEARENLFAKMGSDVSRKLAGKALTIGANAVIGYRQAFDLEAGSSNLLVCRAIGTAVEIAKTSEGGNPHEPVCESVNVACTLASAAPKEMSAYASPVTTKIRNKASFEAKISSCGYDEECAEYTDQNMDECICLKSKQKRVRLNHSTSLPPPEKPADYTIAATGVHPEVCVTLDSSVILESAVNQPLLTVTKLPPHLLKHVAAVVCARSVKLLKESDDTGLESRERDSWWMELRNEIKSQMKMLSCNIVVGYSEEAKIYDEVCVLTAVGTAAFAIDPALLPNFFHSCVLQETSSNRNKDEFAQNGHDAQAPEHEEVEVRGRILSGKENGLKEDSEPYLGCSPSCSIYHVPYHSDRLPFAIKLQKCKMCQKGSVPDVLVSTLDPVGPLTTESPQLVQARIVRKKPDHKGENLAKQISEMLPFLEHQLHSELLSKTRSLGKNAVFGLKMDLAIGDLVIVALASGTAFSVVALPSPPQVIFDASMEDKFKFPVPAGATSESTNGSHVIRKLDDFSISDNKPENPPGILAVNVDINGISGSTDHVTFSNLSNLHMCYRVYREEIDPDTFTTHHLTKIMNKLLKTTVFKYRKLRPVCISNLAFGVNLPEDDKIQVKLSALISSGSDQSCEGQSRRAAQKSLSHSPADPNGSFNCPRQAKDPASVVLTPACHPGSEFSVEAYLGHLQLFFIRETTDLKEDGGLSAFVHMALSDIICAIQSHTWAIGADMLLSASIPIISVRHSSHNHAQTLVSAFGDMVKVK